MADLTPKQIIELVLLAEQAAGPLLELAGKLRTSSGLSDDQLLEHALTNNIETRDKVKAFLDRLNSAVPAPAPATDTP